MPPRLTRSRPTVAVAVVAFVVLALLSGCGKSENRGSPNTGSGIAPVAGTHPSTTAPPPRNQWDKVAYGAPVAFAASPHPRDVADPAHPAPTGVYMWDDLAGWHVRVVRNPSSPLVEVTVTANTADLSSVKIANIINSTDPLPAPATSVTVKLPAAAAASGFDMSTGFYTSSLSFNVKSGTTAFPAGQIFLGPVPTPATANPVPLTLSSTPH